MFGNVVKRTLIMAPYYATIMRVSVLYIGEKLIETYNKFEIAIIVISNECERSYTLKTEAISSA